ncbi:UDP-N-acetylglucosamine--N-acetylmuramyl-(pentapeptide) pyrophosphoryl-undecaprenol N-acetylglucosamine transferase [Patescibacteria group bacterium]|nr:UDP-N-acetylglucosamine--N-acetylmuramyl-(pentapeptide) pyrophosphoryl-undecaprenol N-acetylglucosamine transferase [Patescibacteria group bacterium]
MNKSKKKKIVLAGGGSGGHVIPLLSIYDRIKDTYDVLFVGLAGGSEMQLLDRKKIEYQTIYAGKLRRYFDLRNIIDILLVPYSIIQCLYILWRYKPDLVFTKGGNVSLPVAIAAWMLGLPILAHESDSVMGLSNSIISKFAGKIAVAFPVGCYNGYSEEKMVWAGMPIREWKVQKSDIPKARKFFALDNDLPVLLITGGSQGAVSINTYVMNNIVDLLEFCNVIHITGETDFKRVESKKINIVRGKGKYLIFDFMYDDYDRAIMIADIVISRAGSTLAELSDLAKPSILVPLPHSAGNHQYFNAKSFEDMGASVMVEERDFDRINLAVLVESILSDEERLEEMKAAAATAMMTEGSAQIISDLIDSMVEKYS